MSSLGPVCCPRKKSRCARVRWPGSKGREMGGGSSSEVIFRSGTGSGGGWVRRGREEDAEGTCVGRGVCGRKDGPGGERG